ncbi:MAG: hypothetical protein ACLGIF_02320 [Actinomycetes bacterium]
MTAGEQVLGPASVRWNDYVGTAAADDADALRGAPSLCEVAGLDRDRWLVVGIDLGVAEGDPGVTVYAVDRSAEGVRTLAELDELATDEGRLRVTAFPLSPSQRVERFVNDAFQRIAIRLVARPLKDHPLEVSTADASRLPAV